MMNFIGVPNLDSKCSTSLGEVIKEPGKKWMDLVKASGGHIESICESSLGVAIQ